jgi:hypothetical protein
MFALPIAKQKTKSAEFHRAPVAQQRHGQSVLSPVQLLQRRIGHQALMRLLSQRQNEPSAAINAAAFLAALQPKLTIGAVNDPLEHEADRVAGQVMRMPPPEISAAVAPQVSRKCAECEEEEKLQKEAATAEAGYVPESVHEVLRSPGQPLDTATRAFFEPRFGYDFSRIRIHADGEASATARALQARAYTLGRDVVFGAGEYAPSTAQGKRLLAHELTHVLQQGAAATGQSQANNTSVEKSV